ncbi:MAG: 6-phosphogluconolactonase [Pseudohongiellaceae bacterium]
MMIRQIEFTTAENLNEALAQEIASTLDREIRAKGYANLAVSGGRTPAGMFSLLSEKALDWANVNITLVDERWVETTSRDSNEKLLRETLLQNNAGAAHFIPLKQDLELTESALQKITAQLQHDKAFPFDMVTLGLGEDGHTASLFPCADEIYTAMSETNPDLLIKLTPRTAPYNRISFTLNALLRSGKICLHLVGSNKLEVLKRARSADNIMEMPIRAFLQNEQIDFTIYWAPH